MRIKDKVFEDDWKQTKKIASGSNTLVLVHLLFGVATIAIIIIQSALSINIYVFTVWLFVGLISLIFDVFRGNNITIKTESTFVFFLVIGTALSVILGNVNSMFFPDTLGRLDIILFQVSAGLCVVIRLSFAMFFIEFHSQDKTFIIPESTYASEQLKQYQENLLLTDFEVQKHRPIKSLYRWEIILHRMLWPFISLLVMVLVAILYSLLIYFIIPEDSIAEFIIRPSLIIIAILYTVLLIRTNAVLPKIKDEPVPIDSMEKVPDTQIESS